MPVADDAPSPLVSRRLLLAVAASLLLHGLLFVGPRLDLRPLPELKPLDVKLVRTTLAPTPLAAPVPPPAPPAAKKKPRPKPQPEQAQAKLDDALAPPPVPAPEPAPTPAEPVVADAEAPAPSAATAETDAVPAAAAADNAPEHGAAPATDAAPAGQAWPRAGRITYAALMGEMRYPMGGATHQWEVDDDGRYRLSELVEPTTVAQIPWFRPGRKLRESSGRITATGLRPERFVEREEGRLGERVAELDWPAQQLRSGAGNGALPPNVQDALSFFYQLGYPGVAAAGELPVTAGGPLETYRLEQVGEESVRLPFGETWRTQHVRVRYGSGRETMDVWLAVEHFGLPVLIRTLDAKGVVYYLVATEIRVSAPAAAQPDAR